MKIREIIRLIKMSALIVTSAAMTSATVFASEEYPGVDYPPQINNVPGFYITGIDLTNNQIEFTLNTLIWNEPARFGVSWIDSEEYLNADIRSFSGVNESWMTKVFWSDDYNLDLESYHLDDVAGYLRRYVVDSEVDLKDDTLGVLYYIIETNDGNRWVNKATYGNCAQGWVDGKACVMASLRNNTEVDSVNYTLADAPEKYINKNIPRSVPEEPVIEEPEPVVEPEPEAEPEPVVEPEPEAEPEPVVEPEPEAEPEPTEKPEPVIEFESTAETEPEPVDEQKTDMIEDEMPEPVEVEEEDKEEDKEEDGEVVKIAAIDIPSTQDTVTDTDDEVVEEVYEGFGDTTLEVPLLGEIEEDIDSSECEKTDILPYIILGFLIGAISTLFLLLIINRVKTLHSIDSE